MIWLLFLITVGVDWSTKLHPTDTHKMLLTDLRQTCDNSSSSSSRGRSPWLKMLGAIHLSSPALLVPRDRERQTFSLMTTLVLPPETKTNFVLSMWHHMTEVSVCEDRKSANILDDNHCKGDVDHLDEVIGSHNISPPSLTLWTSRLTQHVCDMDVDQPRCLKVGCPSTEYHRENTFHPIKYI